jgi:hypothetical protein
VAGIVSKEKQHDPGSRMHEKALASQWDDIGSSSWRWRTSRYKGIQTGTPILHTQNTHEVNNFISEF